MDTIQKVVIIGKGRVGTALANFLPKIGIEICATANSTTPFETLPKEMDLCIVAVKDDAVEEVVNKVQEILKPKYCVHTSGTQSLHSGVLYFFQSFQTDCTPVFLEIPTFIEMPNKKDEIILEYFAKKFSRKVFVLCSDKRRYLHLAGVFANNFANAMFGTAHDILQKQNLPPDIIDVLIRQTAQNALNGNAWKAQTGPAVRHDKKTMETHLDLLAKDSDLKEIYTNISEIIQKKICETTKKN